MVSFEVVLRPNFKSQDHYEVLGCHPSDSQVEITKAYRDLSRMYHPKNWPNDEDAVKIFVRIGQAYAALVGPEDIEKGAGSTRGMSTVDAKRVYESQFGKYRKRYQDDAGIIGLPFAYVLKQRLDVKQRTMGCGSQQRFTVGILRTWNMKRRIDVFMALCEVVLTWGTIAACE
jgi:curved DNA-binding protein CbpA